MNNIPDHIKNFYEPAHLRSLLKSHAALNIILNSTDWSRYHHYTKNWAPGVDMAQIDNGSGDNVFIFFTAKGVLIKGFDHESQVSPHAQEEYAVWEGMYEGLPPHFDELLNDEAMEKEDVTFCIWRETNDTNWKRGNVVFKNDENDGSSFLLGTIYKTPAEFQDWANSYYEIEAPLHLIEAVYNGEQLTDERILALNPEADTEKVRTELDALYNA